MQTVSVLSWNIQGKPNFSGYTSYAKSISHLVDSGADIIALQEIHGAEKKLRKSALALTHNMFIPKRNKLRNIEGKQSNFNVLLSRYPIIDADEVIFPQWKRGVFLENAIRAHIKVGEHTLRVYTGHFRLFRAGMATRVKQLEFILRDASTHEGPVIFCGDLNTALPKFGIRRVAVTISSLQPWSEALVNGSRIKTAERDIIHQTLSRHGFREALDLHAPTWSPIKSDNFELFKQKLDWFMIKNLDIEHVHLGDYISDHKPVLVSCKIG